MFEGVLRALCLSMALTVPAADCFADIDPGLIGVWEAGSYGKGFRHEFSRDGTWTRWEYVRTGNGRGPENILLIVKDRLAIERVSTGIFRTIEPDAVTVGYKLGFKPGVQKLKEASLTYGENGVFDTVSYRKLDFDEDVTGSFQLHRNHAFEARVNQAIEAGDAAGVKKLLLSAEADFLKRAAESGVQGSGAALIGPRLWFSAIGSGNADLVAVVGEYLPNYYLPVFIDAAQLYGGSTMVALLQKLRGIDATALTDDEISRLDKLLTLEKWVRKPYLFANNLKKTFCTDADNPEYEQRGASAQLYRQQQDQFWRGELLRDPTALARLFEQNLRHCLEKYSSDGRISNRLLNARTIPGRSSYSDVVTPLYFYAHTQRRSSQGLIYKYTLLKVLLDYGADPAIKPGKDSAALSDYLYEQANHARFGQLNRKLKNTYVVKSAPESSLIAAELAMYNAIMQRIGGHAYASPD